MRCAHSVFTRGLKLLPSGLIGAQYRGIIWKSPCSPASPTAVVSHRDSHHATLTASATSWVVRQYSAASAVICGSVSVVAVGAGTHTRGVRMTHGPDSTTDAAGRAVGVVVVVGVAVVLVVVVAVAVVLVVVVVVVVVVFSGCKW